MPCAVAALDHPNASEAAAMLAAARTDRLIATIILRDFPPFR
jgi:hypothetical protein